ncbi:MAG: ATP-binding protein [Chloroflexi bacterium]|nr:ATP-binding protein [Chloroflexota bacterium]MCI0643592.1 ATP-binding protein [Chloroflexota bacterium]MCI0726214.1 ATP-binding protein [Chloroflexota bacterium]
MLSHLRPSQIPLRIRLTLWYVLSLGFILVLFTTFLYLQVRRSLVAQVDAALHLAATQALLSLGEEGGQLAFQNVERNPEAMRNLNDDFVIHLLAQDGTVLDTLSNDDDVPVFPVQATGFRTLIDEEDPWRVYSQEVAAGSITGRVQVAQELEPVVETLASLQAQIVLGLPLALLLAGLGGFFLASRALRPIDHITQTARAISASDLGQRIRYQGPADEVGRLAQTFDNMLDRLQAAFGRERRFTGDAAHELRTPLAALKGRIGVTLSRPRQPAAYVETLQEMEQQVDRLIRLSNDLLFMARLDQGQFRPQTERIELADFMAAVMDQVRPLAEAKAITLVESIPPGLTLQGDLDLLIRLHLNLLDNAVKYTPAGGRVTVQAERMGTQVIVSVSDTGPGIPAEHLPHLFERFYRVEGDRARGWRDNGQGGAGLGLAIAYEIARAHGGHLAVQSEVGRGTTFVVYLS